MKNNFHSTQNKFSTHYDIVEEELKSTTVGKLCVFSYPVPVIHSMLEHKNFCHEISYILHVHVK